VNDDDEQTRTNIHALSGIRTHGLSVKAIKAYASDRTVTGTGMAILIRLLFPRFLQANAGTEPRTSIYIFILSAHKFCL
jgi:hypothetical protein